HVGLVSRAGQRVEDPLLRFGGAVRYPSGARLPGTWRRIRIDVEPERLRAYWAERLTDPPKLFLDLTAAQLDDSFGKFRPMLDRTCPGLGNQLPGWNPRSGLGIWSRGSAVAVKNVTIEPLPKPR
ncbi:MAG TPA: hypothetical protein VMZ71_08260, partial [Gemmataceae bacterium]|nr:hypothetical protein [Gemmataceae bacterium]